MPVFDDESEERAGEEKFDARSKEFCAMLGACLVSWQSIEQQLFFICMYLLDVDSFDVCSAVFHHIRAFDQKVELVNKLCLIQLNDEADDMARWKALAPELKSMGSLRDRLVHYAAYGGYDTEEGLSSPMVIMPPWHNVSLKIKGKAPEPPNPEHFITYGELCKAVLRFNSLHEKMQEFGGEILIRQSHQERERKHH